MQQTVVITGANRGIGLALARSYAADGCRVHATCRQPERAAELAALAEASDGRITVHPLDVADPAQIAALAAVLADTPVDVLINNAGIYPQKGAAFGSIDVDDWLHGFRINTIAPFKVLEALADRVAASRRRLVANISSKMGSIADNGSGGSYAYRSSKTALNMAMASAAIDLRDRGIAVILLHPGWVQTDMGGGDAPIEVDESVTALRGVLDRATLEDSGRFFDRNGAIVPW